MPSPSSEAFVWVWQPGADEPVVAGIVRRSGDRYRFAYASSYLDRSDASSLYGPELPLRPGWIEPLDGLVMPGALRDAAPDAWGRRVILERLFGTTERDPVGDVDEITFLLESGSDRTGALDFQNSAADYVERGNAASLDELHGAARALADGHALSPEMAAALLHGMSVGGARPKVTFVGGERGFIAKLSTTTDTYPVVEAEAVGLDLASRVGLDVPASSITESLGHDVLLVERFDRSPQGHRAMMVSGLTMLGLDEFAGRYATYPDLLDVLRRLGSDPFVGVRLFERIVFNIAIGNNDDHPRNHAAFWDGDRLTLTPAYDLCPQARSGETSAQAMAIDRAGDRRSSFRVCVDAAHIYGLDRHQARDIIDAQTQTIREAWTDVAEANRLTEAERRYLFGRQILNPSIFHTLPGSA